ncbi:hypothetical protein DINM_003342 [Dirofilaria immitis]|nr:hypothetical protein [Dirofilaria immitis]
MKVKDHRKLKNIQNTKRRYQCRSIVRLYTDPEYPDHETLHHDIELQKESQLNQRKQMLSAVEKSIPIVNEKHSISYGNKNIHSLEISLMVCSLLGMTGFCALCTIFFTYSGTFILHICLALIGGIAALIGVFTHFPSALLLYMIIQVASTVYLSIIATLSVSIFFSPNKWKFDETSFLGHTDNDSPSEIFYLKDPVKLLSETVHLFIIPRVVGGQQMHDGNGTDEQHLLRYLLNHYEKAVRPVKNASNTVIVMMGMTITNIFDMDEKNQVLTINVWLDQEWKDELLVWDPKEFDGIESIRVPCDLIWLPDIVLYNKQSKIFSADDYTTDYMASRAILFYDGTVFWPLQHNFVVLAKLMSLIFHSIVSIVQLNSARFQVDITNRSGNVDLSNYVESGEFDLVRVFQKRRIVKYTCCLEPYPDVTFYIHIRRKTLYYLYNVVFPCLMMSVLTLFVFILPPDSSEKITLGITVLLAFSVNNQHENEMCEKDIVVFVLAIAEKMPETSDSIPLIGIYLTIVMLLTSISVVMTVMVLNFHHRGPFDHPVPEWVRVLVLQKLRHFLRVHLQYSIDNRNDLFGSNNQPRKICSQEIIGLKSRGQFKDRLLWLKETEFINVDGHLTARRTKRSIDLQVRLYNILQTFLKRQETNELYQMLASEWRQVAYVIDRLLFWIFFVCTVVITVILLVIIPIRYRSSDDFLDENSDWNI